MVTDRFYYKKMNERDRKIYKAIYDGIMHYKEFAEVPDVTLRKEIVGWIYHCVLWDNPFIFSVGEYAMWDALYDNDTKIKITTLCDAESEKVFRKQVENEVNSILSATGLDKLSDFQKEVFVHDFIINNIKYDQTCGDDGKRIEPYTVYGALVEHKAVCEGIAKTVKLLLNLLDVNCIVVSGKYKGNAHSWNMVNIKEWSYNLDVTMDMGRVIHDRKMRYNYFNFRDKDIEGYELTNAHLYSECTAIRNNYLVRTRGLVSNDDQLRDYIHNALEKRRNCLYIKANKNIDEGFSKLSFKAFQEKVNNTYNDVVKEMGISTKVFIDVTGPCDIISMEVSYL